MIHDLLDMSDVSSQITVLMLLQNEMSGFKINFYNVFKLLAWMSSLKLLFYK